MADEFDGCECVWSHEMVMRQLLSLIRQGQTLCTDTECIDIPRQDNNNDGFFFSMIITMFMFFVILSLTRVNISTRSKKTIDKSQHSNGKGPDDGSPPLLN